MPDLAALADPNYRPPKGPPCGVGHLLSTADADTADLVIKALANPFAGSLAIRDSLSARGYSVPVTSIRRHRRGECRCET